MFSGRRISRSVSKVIGEFTSVFISVGQHHSEKMSTAVGPVNPVFGKALLSSAVLRFTLAEGGRSEFRFQVDGQEPRCWCWSGRGIRDQQPPKGDVSAFFNHHGRRVVIGPAKPKVGAGPSDGERRNERSRHPFRVVEERITVCLVTPGYALCLWHL